jgi:hypothetical protein
MWEALGSPQNSGMDLSRGYANPLSPPIINDIAISSEEISQNIPNSTSILPNASSDNDMNNNLFDQNNNNQKLTFSMYKNAVINSHKNSHLNTKNSVAFVLNIEFCIAPLPIVFPHPHHTPRALQRRARVNFPANFEYGNNNKNLVLLKKIISS